MTACPLIIVQRSASELRVIDYIEDSHRKLSDYVEDLKAMPYNWGIDGCRTADSPATSRRA